MHPFEVVKKIQKRKELKSKTLSYVEQCKITCDLLLSAKQSYNIAISYHAPGTLPVFYVIDKIKAKRKILWLHGDLNSNAGDSILLQEYHSKYDKVYAVSKSVQESFLKYHQDMENRTEVFYNYIDVDGIRQKAKNGETFSDNFKGTRILSVGRLDVQKGFDIAIQVCRYLITDGHNVRWYVLGEGSERDTLENMIHEYELENYFILMGNKNNPYGYIKDCDLFLQTSRHEGYGLAINEAKILHKPVITTDVAGAREQFENNITGWIVANNPESILAQIEWCLNHPKQIETVKENLKHAKLRSEENLLKLLEA